MNSVLKPYQNDATTSHLSALWLFFSYFSFSGIAQVQVPTTVKSVDIPWNRLIYRRIGWNTVKPVEIPRNRLKCCGIRWNTVESVGMPHNPFNVPTWEDLIHTSNNVRTAVFWLEYFCDQRSISQSVAVIFSSCFYGQAGMKSRDLPPPTTMISAAFARKVFGRLWTTLTCFLFVPWKKLQLSRPQPPLTLTLVLEVNSFRGLKVTSFDSCDVRHPEINERQRATFNRSRCVFFLSWW